MLKRLYSRIALLLPFLLIFLASDGFSQNMTKQSIIDDLNSRLAAKNSPIRVIAFDNENWKQGAIVWKQNLSFGNAEVKYADGHIYRNNSSIVQQETFTISEEVTSGTEFTTTVGLEISLELEVGGGLPGLVETKVTAGTKLSASAGSKKSDSTTKKWETAKQIRIPAYTIMTVSASVKQRESVDLPFEIPVYAKGTFKVKPESLQTLYRYWYAGGVKSDHFYTTNQAEAKAYKAEGVACQIYSKQVKDTVALHRLYNPAINDHFYSLNPKEGVGGGWNYEGVVGYVYPPGSNAVPGLVALHRCYSGSAGDHFYTTNESEARGAGGYQYEGVACMVIPADYNISVSIDDPRMLPDEKDRTFVVKGVAKVAQLLETTVDYDEEKIPKKEQSGKKTVKVENESFKKVSTAKKDKMKQKLSKKLGLKVK